MYVRDTIKSMFYLLAFSGGIQSKIENSWSLRNTQAAGIYQHNQR